MESDRIYRQDIMKYLSQATRNRLVFCHERIEGLSFVNVGKVLSECLVGQNLRSSMIAYAAEETLNDILYTPNEDGEIGSYVAIENIGILFEPDLSFNLKLAFDNASTNKLLVVLSDGIIKADCFHFLSEGDNSYIDLHGLSYIEIK